MHIPHQVHIHPCSHSPHIPCEHDKVLISWLSASSYTLSCCGQHWFVIALTAPLKKEKVIAFSSILVACVTNQAPQSVGGTHLSSVPLGLCHF